MGSPKKLLMGAKVKDVLEHHDYITIIFDNGFSVEVSAPMGEEIEEIVQKVVT